MSDEQKNRSAVLLEFGFLWDKMNDEIVQLRARLAAAERVVEAAMALVDAEQWSLAEQEAIHSIFRAVKAYRAALATPTTTEDA